MSVDKIKYLEREATLLTGIPVVEDKEYQRIFYEKPAKVIARRKGSIYKSKRKIL